MLKLSKCVDPKTGAGEKSLYENEEGWKYLRIRDGGGNRRVALGTKSLTKAVELRDKRQAFKVAAKLGLPVTAPADAAAANKATVPVVVKRYIKDGYPNKKGVARKPGKHRAAEEAYRGRDLVSSIFHTSWGFILRNFP